MYMKWKEDLRAGLKGSNNEGDGENLCRRLDSEAIAFAGKLVELCTHTLSTTWGMSSSTHS